MHAVSTVRLGVIVSGLLAATAPWAAEQSPLEFLQGIYSHDQSDDANPLDFSSRHGAGQLLTNEVARERRSSITT